MTKKRGSAIGLAMLALAAATAAIAAGAQTASPAAAAPPMAFSAVSVKPDNDAADRRTTLHSTPGGLIGAATLKTMVKNAYHLLSPGDYELVGATGWMTTDRFAIDATAPAKASYSQNMHMLQGLLADRFGLKVTWRAVNVPGYELVVAQGGSKFQLASADERSVKSQPDVANGLKYTQTNLPLMDLASWLEWPTAGPIVDKTGLAGNYDIALEFARPLAFGPSDDPAGASEPSLFTAMKEQLGLELKARRVPIQQLAIVSAHKPSPN